MNHALDINGREHAIEIKVLQEKIEPKEILARKLKLKNDSIKCMNSSKRYVSCTHLGDPSSSYLMMRNITMTSEIVNTSIDRLEAMIKNIVEYNQPAEVIYDSGADIPDELTLTQKLGVKISLVK